MMSSWKRPSVLLDWDVWTPPLGTNSYVYPPGLSNVFFSIVVVHRGCTHALLFRISPRERERERERDKT